MYNSGSLEQLVFISALLAGFSFTGVTQLLALKDDRKITTLTMGAFVLATGMLIAGALVGSLLLIRAGNLGTLGPDVDPGQFQRRTESAGLSILLPISLGLISFLIGLGFTGWIKSQRVGIFTTVVSVIAFGFTFYILANL